MPPDGYWPLRVGLNLIFLGPGAGGIGRYARELIGGLLSAEPATDLTLFVRRDCAADLDDETWASEVRRIAVPAAVSGRASALVQHAVLPFLAAGLRLDVLHSPANVGPVIAPGVATVLTLHDLIWLRYAEAWEADPRAAQALRRQVVFGVRHADRVFATTDAARRDIVEDLDVPARNIVLTPMGVRRLPAQPLAERALREKLALNGARVLLCVSQKRPYKNQASLVRALQALDPDIVLVAPGASTPYETELRSLSESLGLEDRVRLPSWLSDTELSALYGLADVFALPSKIEGFGLPVLEAMAHGLPVACADIPALREVSAEAALRFAPNDQPAIDGCLVRLFGDAALRADLIRRGSDRVQHFTWTETGAASLRGYREALTARRSASRARPRRPDG